MGSINRGDCWGSCRQAKVFHALLRRRPGSAACSVCLPRVPGREQENEEHERQARAVHVLAEAVQRRLAHAGQDSHAGEAGSEGGAKPDARLASAVLVLVVTGKGMVVSQYMRAWATAAP